jgi:hypothetical protein
MTEALVLWVFMVLIQQQGMVVSGGSSLTSCEEGLAAALTDAKALSQQVLAISECQQITLKPVK